MVDQTFEKLVNYMAEEKGLGSVSHRWPATLPKSLMAQWCR